MTKHLVEACALCLSGDGAYVPATKAHREFSPEGAEGTILLCDACSLRYSAAWLWVADFFRNLYHLNDDDAPSDAKRSGTE
jgi:hypothetical protein